MEFIKSDYFLIALIVILFIITFLFINSKIGFVSIKKKKIRMELEHFSDIYKITAEELEELNDSEQPNNSSIYVLSLYLNNIKGKIAGYCYLLDYTYECGIACVFIYDKNKNDIFKNK